MTSKIRFASSWLPTAALTGAGFLCGVATASLLFLGIESDKIQDLRNEVVTARAKVDALELASESVNMALKAPMTPFAITAAPPPAQAVTVKVQEVIPPPTQPARPAPPAAPAPTISKPVAQKPAPAAPAKPTPATPPKQSPESAPAKTTTPAPNPAPSQTPKTSSAGAGIDLPLPSTPAAPAAPQKPPVAAKPVTDPEVKAAMEKNTIEMAPKAKMGVSTVENGVVVMGSGVRVNVGDRFSSGERLLSADKETGRIVTDQRTVVIMN